MGTGTGKGHLAPPGCHRGRLPGGGGAELPPERRASQRQDSSPVPPPLPWLSMGLHLVLVNSEKWAASRLRKMNKTKIKSMDCFLLTSPLDSGTFTLLPEL